MGFYGLDAKGKLVEPMVIELEVTGPTQFAVLKRFRFYDFDRNHCDVELRQATDLASVPFFLQWLVRSYGRHTAPAILHDALWRGTAEIVQAGAEPTTASDGQAAPTVDSSLTPKGAGFKSKRKANKMFRDGMWSMGVPLVRRWFMWAAVAAATGWWRAPIWGATLVVALSAGTLEYDVRLAGWPTTWVVASLGVVAVIAVLVAIVGGGSVRKAALTGAVLSVAAALCVVIWWAVGRSEWIADKRWCVIIGCLVVGVLLAWLPDIRAGLIATAALPVIVVPVVAIFGALLVYVLIEVVLFLLAEIGRSILGRPRPNPPAASTLSNRRNRAIEDQADFDEHPRT